jgi:hypothetical protein
MKERKMARQSAPNNRGLLKNRFKVQGSRFKVQGARNIPMAAI